MNNIYQISEEYNLLYDKLENGEGIDLETGEIDEDLLKSLEVTKEELNKKAIDYAYIIKNFEDESLILKNEIDRLTKRKKYCENIISRLKNTVTDAMLQFNISEIKGNTLRLSFRKSEKVEITDESKLSEEFMVIKKEPNKILIKEALKNGTAVDGAELVINQNLQIK